MHNKLLASVFLLTVSATLHAAPFANGDASLGKKMFDQHKCSSCHITKVGGDGSAMFTRAERKVKNPAALARQITACTNNLGLALFEEDEVNLGAYLNTHYYKFK